MLPQLTVDMLPPSLEQDYRKLAANPNGFKELARKLISLQHPEGFWVNTDKAELQDNKVLVTTFTMMAIEATLQ